MSKPVIHVPFDMDELLTVRDALERWECEVFGHRLEAHEKENLERVKSMVNRINDSYSELAKWSKNSQ
jgi:hypothetical protein